MNLQALMVSTDDAASELLGRVLPNFGIAVERFSDPETALARLHQQKFDALVLDFDDPELARQVHEQARTLGSGSSPLTVALVADPSKVRAILSAGSHFVLYKPLAEGQARAGLRAAAALLNRERRRAVRVPVQAPVELTLPDERKMEGILLDLSETGMDVLTAEPQFPGALLGFRFVLPAGDLEVKAHGQVAWANPNGQTGVHFIDVEESVRAELKTWLQNAVTSSGGEPDEAVPHCKLSDLSLGGCYVESDAPFPERSMVDLCFKTGEMEVHTEGMVRVAHPGHGMGLEFPSRTPEQRAQVENLINFLRSSADRAPELYVSPRALVADLTQFEHSEVLGESSEEMEDPLLELVRRGTTLQQDEFVTELRRQRSPEEASV
ncbi:MAG TPA: PilZ domain-containing protein [Candidatus Sulfotelmatobacter sp.]|nr:PilZ domain-containing protein [Candidatus Sulfotelmatobacter sp.]